MVQWYIYSVSNAPIPRGSSFEGWCLLWIGIESEVVSETGINMSYTQHVIHLILAAALLPRVQLSLSLSHSLTLSLSHSLTLSLSHSLTLSLSNSLTLSLSHSLTLSLSLSLTHSLTHSHIHTHKLHMAPQLNGYNVKLKTYAEMYVNVRMGIAHRKQCILIVCSLRHTDSLFQFMHASCVLG